MTQICTDTAWLIHSHFYLVLFTLVVHITMNSEAWLCLVLEKGIVQDLIIYI